MFLARTLVRVFFINLGMSHLKLKTEYKETVDSWGNTETKTIYADHNLSCDIITFYDENMKVIFSVEDCMKNNLFEALTRLYNADKEGTEPWFEKEF